MPNPLLGPNLGRRLVTSKPVDDRPHAVEPLPEAYVGDNNPYRGVVDHGVPVSGSPDGFHGYADTISGVYEPERDEPDPIPVRVVNVAGRELRRFRTGQEILDSTTGLVARMLAGRNLARVDISIKNTGAQTMWIGENESVALYTGYPLAAGAEKVFTHQDAIFAVAASGQTTTVAILEQFTVRDR